MGQGPGFSRSSDEHAFFGAIQAGDADVVRSSLSALQISPIPRSLSVSALPRSPPRPLLRSPKRSPLLPRRTIAPPPPPSPPRGRRSPPPTEMGDEGAASSAESRKRGRDGELKRVAEVVMVLSAMAEMRGGRDPTTAERAMVAEARERLARVCEGVRPKDLFSREIYV